MLELDPAVTYACVPPDRIVFFTPVGKFTIMDKAGFVGRVLDCLSKQQPLEDVFKCIPEKADRELVREGVLGALKARRIVRESPAPRQADKGDDLLGAWLRFAGGGAEQIGSIGVFGDGPLGALFLQEVESLGLVACAAETVDPKFDLIVLCQEYPDISRLRAVNKDAVACHVPFFPVTIDRHVVSLGPVIIPGATACMECMYHRAQMNAAESMEAHEDMFALATSTLVVKLGAVLGAIEAARFLSGAIYDLDVASCVRHSVLTGKRSHSVVLKLPRCPVCGIGGGGRPLADTFVTNETALLEGAK